MTSSTPRVSGVTLLATAVLLLLPALAWLQYNWLDQIADADRDRRARTLQTATSQLAQDFDGEIGKAVFGLQLEPGMVEQQNWSAFADRYQVWASNALTPDMVSAVYFAEVPREPAHRDTPVLRAWNTVTRTFDVTPWPATLDRVRARLTSDEHAVVNLQFTPAGRRGERGDRADRTPQRLILPGSPIGDDQSLVVPVMRITIDMPSGAEPPPPPDVTLLGFTVIQLNLDALARDLIPLLVRRHLYDDEGHTDYVIAVVNREDPSRVVFESEGGAAVTARQPVADQSVPLLGPRMGPFVFAGRDARRPGGRVEMTREYRTEPLVPPPPPPPAPPRGASVAAENVVVNVVEARRNERGVSLQSRGFATAEGHWELVAKHRAGSLEAAVTAARTRNFILSSGILALLATTIGLIVVSARRADRLARQQLEFVAAVSHELRTPVSVIGAAAGNLADGLVGDPSRVKTYGATIQGEARRLGETVERVLQLAGIAAGRAAASPVLVAGHQLISDALTGVAHDAERAGVTIERDIPEALPAVRGDRSALASALQNLLGNAVKYGGPGGWVRVSAHVAGRMLRISVEDRGLGIAADERQRIFEPFYRGREAVTRQIQGSGLGLHLVKRIVEAHGGTVSVDSESGRGSTFTMALPEAADDGHVQMPGYDLKPGATRV